MFLEAKCVSMYGLIGKNVLSAYFRFKEGYMFTVTMVTSLFNW